MNYVPIRNEEGEIMPYDEIDQCTEIEELNAIECVDTSKNEIAFKVFSFSFGVCLILVGWLV